MKYSNIRDQINKFHMILHMDSDQAIKEMHNLVDNGIIFTLIPDFTKFKKTAEIDGFTYKNVLEHSLKVYESACREDKDATLRFAALVHDIGKSATRKFVEGKGWNFHGHDKVGASMVIPIMRMLKFKDDDIKNVSLLVGLHMRPMKLFEDNITDSAVRRLITLAGDQMPRLMKLCKCDFTTNNEDKRDIILNRYNKILDRISNLIDYDKFRLFTIVINGDMIMKQLNLQPGQYITDIKDAFKKEVMEGRLENTVEVGEKFIKDYALNHDLSQYGYTGKESC